jgi:hypothetical protein
VFALLASGVAGPRNAVAQEAEPEKTGTPVGFHLMVGHLSPEPGPVDPELESLHRILAKEFRYESMRILMIRELVLQLEEVGAIDLPTGKRVQIRPIHLGRSGVLVAVDIEDSGQLDLRVPNRRPVVLGTDNYDGGKLFFTLQPDY